MHTSLSPKPEPQLAASPLSGDNIAAALKVADLCFPHPEDQSFLRGHWSRVLDGSVSYFCPDDQDHLTLLDHFVYLAQGEVVAFGGLYRHDRQPNCEWLNWFGVDPTYRGYGYGKTLVEHLSGLALDRGATTLVGYTENADENIGTKRFYESLQFRPTSLYSFRGEEVRLFERQLTKDR